MKTHSEEFEAFPADETTEVLARGFIGGIVGASVFSFFVAVYATTIVGAFAGSLAEFFGFFLGVLLEVFGFFLGVLFIVVSYYTMIGGVCFLLGFGFSRLIGHRLDLRLVATLTACCTAYLPAVLVLNTPGGRSAPITYPILVGVLFSIPMSCVAIGAWVAADREFHDLKVESDRSGQFDLKLLFGVTLILAALMLLRALLNLEASFFIGFFVALVPTSIFTALVAWVRAIVKKPVSAPD